METEKTFRRETTASHVDATAAELSTFVLEEAEDNRILKSTLWGAFAFHLVLLLINFPALGDRPQAYEEKTRKVFPVKQFKVRLPEIPKEQIPERRVRKIPIPDPTPDQIEPLRLYEPDAEIDLPDVDVGLMIPSAPPARPMPDEPIIVSGDVRKPEKIHAPQPRYTEIARKARIQGQVIVQAIIDRQGDVTEVKVLKGLPMGLTEEAVKAVRQWKFKPATLRGKPVDVYFNLVVRFQLQ